MMSRVTSILVRPPAGAVTRAAVATVEITAAACAAHWYAGGVLPSVAWILASAIPVFGMGVLWHRGRVGRGAALLGAAAGQVFFHTVMTGGMTGDMTGHPMGQLMAGHQHDGSPWPMVAAHAVGALATVLVWTLRRQAWDVLVRVSRVRVRALPGRTVMLHEAIDALDAVAEWMAGRRRGPPTWA